MAFQTLTGGRISFLGNISRNYSIMTTLLFMVLLSSTQSLLSSFSVEALIPSSSSNDIVPRQFIELNNPLGSATDQKIPASFVSGWPTWVLDMDGKLSKIPDSDDDGFVSPTSVDELWQPIDLKRPDARLALGLHVRQGAIRHVMPAIDLTLDDGKYRNRGMCSVPRAHAWIDFTNSLDEWANYEIVLKEKKKGEDKWTELHSSPGSKVMDAIKRALYCLAESAPDDLADGSHLINVLLDDKVTVECPKAGCEIRVTMDDDDYLDENVQAPGMLQVMVSAAVAGSESEYLPDVYKPLYEDESLRNPLYARYKERKDTQEG